MSTYTQPLDAFLQAVEALVPLTPAARAYLRTQAVIETLPAHTTIHRAGQPAQRLYYLHTGLARSYYTQARGLQSTSCFFKLGAFMYSPYTFLTDQPASENVELLRAGIHISVSFQALREWHTYYPDTAEFGTALGKQHAILYDERLRAFRDLSSEELYQWFLNRHPDLYGLIPHKILASFMGIAPETLSRIQNKKTINKNFKKDSQN
jgi:CRP-like cAMP-binding protein